MLEIPKRKINWKRFTKPIARALPISSNKTGIVPETVGVLELKHERRDYMSTVPKRTMMFLAAVLISTTTWVRAEESHAVIVQGGVEAKMRDGTVLRADIYRPQDEGKFPVLLERTP